jgi:hypothetical protein
MDAFWHWLNVELWGPMWPNMFAPSVITLAWMGILHVRVKVHLRRHHEALDSAIRDRDRA